MLYQINYYFSSGVLCIVFTPYVVSCMHYVKHPSTHGVTQCLYIEKDQKTPTDRAIGPNASAADRPPSSVTADDLCADGLLR